jgi:hypothetical protein
MPSNLFQAASALCLPVRRNRIEPEPQYTAHGETADDRYQHNTPEVHRTRPVSLIVASATFRLTTVYRIVTKRRGLTGLPAT